MFVSVARGLQDRGKARRESIEPRCAKAAEIIGEWDNGIVWCNLNDESKLISQLSGYTEITGSKERDEKERRINGFTNGEIKGIVTKPKIAGHGLNWQHCNKMVFVGLSDSFESFYQAVRRCWRYGQHEPVDVHIVISDREGAVLENIRRKQRQHDHMSLEMIDIMKASIKKTTKAAILEKKEYNPKLKITMPTFEEV